MAAKKPRKKAADAESDWIGPGHLLPLPWQYSTWQHLTTQYQRGKLPHAILLSGEPGIGKGHLAQAFAQYLLCAEPAGDRACGQCRACNLCAAGTHPDIQDIRPLPSKKIISVDQIRGLIEFTSRTAHYGGARVVVIQPANTMNINAANSLLKCLEEPGPETYLLLISSRDMGLPATVRSRCQRLPLTVADHTSALHWLEPKLGDRQVAEELLAATGGRPLAALAMSDAGGIMGEEVLQQALHQLLSGRAAALDVATAFKQTPLDQLIERLLSFIAIHVKTEIVNNQTEPSKLAATMIFSSELEQLYRSVTTSGNPNVLLTADYLLVRFKEVLGR